MKSTQKPASDHIFILHAVKTGLAGVLALFVAQALRLQYRYTNDPWTRDGQGRANVVGIAPRVPGPIVRIAMVDNQQVERGDLLFEIDPADYQAAVEQAKAQVLAAEVALTQRQQELDRQTALFQKKVNALKDYQDAQDNCDTAKA